jgi:hypothetical protein
MTDRQRLEAIISVICKYLPPDGTPIKEAMSEIISLVDPLPPLPVQEPVKQVSPAEFNHLTKGKEAVTGIPVYWAEWPNKE